MIRLWLLVGVWCGTLAFGEDAMTAEQWKEREPAMLKDLQDYLKINTANPPGDVRDAARYDRATAPDGPG